VVEHLTKESIQEIVKETVETINASVDPCTIWNLFESYCELNNNVTIIVELAIGGGLAAFLYFMQHKSAKKRRETWESREGLAYNQLSINIVGISKICFDHASKKYIF